MWDSQTQPAFPRARDLWILEEEGSGGLAYRTGGAKAKLEAHLHPVRSFWCSYPVSASWSLVSGLFPWTVLMISLWFQLLPQIFHYGTSSASPKPAFCSSPSGHKQMWQGQTPMDYFQISAPIQTFSLNKCDEGMLQVSSTFPSSFVGFRGL